MGKQPGRDRSMTIMVSPETERDLNGLVDHVLNSRSRVIAWLINQEARRRQHRTATEGEQHA